MLSLIAIGVICRHSFISLNFTGLVNIVTGICIQFSMTSRNENEAVNAATAFAYLKTYHFTGNLGASIIEHVSEMELYKILSTLEKFECWNGTVLITKYQ